MGGLKKTLIILPCVDAVLTLHQSISLWNIHAPNKYYVMHAAGPRGHRSEQGGAPGASLHVSSWEANGSRERETEMGRWKAH